MSWQLVKEQAEGMGWWGAVSKVGAVMGAALASCQLAPAAGPCQSKLPNEKL